MNCTPGSLVTIGLKTLRMLSGTSVLGVPQVEVAGAALQVDHDHALGGAEAARGVRGRGASAGRRAAPRRACRPSRSASERPRIDEPPTRSSSRRVTPRGDRTCRGQRRRG